MSCERCGSRAHRTAVCPHGAGVCLPPEPERVIQLATLPDGPRMHESIYALTNRGRIFVWSANDLKWALEPGPDLSQ